MPNSMSLSMNGAGMSGLTGMQNSRSNNFSVGQDAMQMQSMRGNTPQNGRFTVSLNFNGFPFMNGMNGMNGQQSQFQQFLPQLREWAVTQNQLAQRRVDLVNQWQQLANDAFANSGRLIDIIDNFGMGNGGGGGTNPPGGFQTLNSLIQTAGLTDTINQLEQQGPITLFAPTNQAFQNLNPMILNQLNQNPDMLAQVLQYHVAGMPIVPGDQPQLIDSLLDQDQAVLVNQPNSPFIINGAQIVPIGNPMQAQNGSITYSLSDVLIPPALQGQLGMMGGMNGTTGLGMMNGGGMQQMPQGFGMAGGTQLAGTPQLNNGLIGGDAFAPGMGGFGGMDPLSSSIVGGNTAANALLTGNTGGLGMGLGMNGLMF